MREKLDTMTGTGRAEKDKRVGRNGIIYLLGLALVSALVLMVDAREVGYDYGDG
jgi:hypothetical protein